MTTGNLDAYACSRCGERRLQVAPHGYQCAACNATIDARYGVPDFNTVPSAPDPTVAAYREQVLRAVRLCLEEDARWQDALFRCFGSDARYALDERKADFLYLLPIGTDTRVLDLGCGLGPVATALAQECAVVYACDRLVENAAFTAIRARQSGIQNLESIACGDDCTLPYRDEMFDLVVMNGVIEWAATGMNEDNVAAREAQLRLLNEVRRVIRRGGLLYITTKNRFALRYLLGEGDEHTGLRFTTWLPRPLVASVVRRIKKIPYRVQLHTPRSLKRLLAAAGLRSSATWYLFPDFRYPGAFVPFDGSARELRYAVELGLPVSSVQRREQVVMELLPPRIALALSYCFAIVAERP